MAADAKKTGEKARSLWVTRAHSEPLFNTVAATQITFQLPVVHIKLVLIAKPPCDKLPRDNLSHSQKKPFFLQFVQRG
ncbi:hypothetical protein [Nitrosomonas sp. Nm84]|uniref:hypothetical protein n=1 Tax=Nitrosomonas sp. Nm84 TaxID=200124 RepID=UPI000D7517C6|nr:hypothetical protein [Nitrosomonas sp. Nm84]